MFKTLLLIIMVSGLISCSNKQGMTTSKIKLFSGNVFAAGGSLYTKANNGLILYGKSNDGKSFLKKVDNDIEDLVFPNGTWNFYAVSWEQVSPQSLFQGKTYCGKSENVLLSGSDISINLNLSNANCNDSAFKSYQSEQYVGGGNPNLITLPSRDFITCGLLG